MKTFSVDQVRAAGPWFREVEIACRNFGRHPSRTGVQIESSLIVENLSRACIELGLIQPGTFEHAGSAANSVVVSLAERMKRRPLPRMAADPGGVIRECERLRDEEGDLSA